MKTRFQHSVDKTRNYSPVPTDGGHEMVGWRTGHFFRAFLIFMLFLIFAHYIRIVLRNSFSPLGGLCEHSNIIIPVMSRDFSDYINVSFPKIRRLAGNLFRFCAEDFTRQALSSNKWLPAWCARLKTSLALKLRRSFEITSLLREPHTWPEIEPWNPFRLPNRLEKEMSLKQQKEEEGTTLRWKRTAHPSGGALKKV